MKYILLLLFLGTFFTAEAQSKRKIIMDERSLTEGEMRKIEPQFLDSMFKFLDNGDLLLNIQVIKGLDTTIVENPITGEVKTVVSRKSLDKKYEELVKKATLGSPKKSDTIYIENPITGALEMRISK